MRPVSRIALFVVVCLIVLAVFTYRPGGSSAQSGEDIITTYAGGGPNNVPAVAANVLPTAIALDRFGNYWVGSANQGRVFKINPSGFLSSPAALNHIPVQAVATDAAGNVYVSDGCTILKFVPSSGTASAIAGDPANVNCGFNGDNIPATQALLSGVEGLAFDALGQLVIADAGNNRVRLIRTDGTIVTIAGNGTAGFSGDVGNALSAELNSPFGVYATPLGLLYIADTGNHRIRQVDEISTILSIAGNGIAGDLGDGLPAPQAELYAPTSIAQDAIGNIFVLDSIIGNLRQITTTSSIIRTVPIQGLNATGALGFALDKGGNLYLPDLGNFRVLKSNEAGSTTSIIAGNELCCYSGNDIPAVDASLSVATTATTDASGNLYIADSGNCIIRKVTPAGVISTIAGVAGNCGDDFPPGGFDGTTLRSPTKAIMDHAGNLYIADTCLIWKSAAISHAMTIYAGTGVCGYSGDGGPAINAMLAGSFGITMDHAGNLFIADSGNQRVRKVNTYGIITTVAGNGVQGFLGDGGTATHAELNGPYDVAADAGSNLYIADTGNNRIRLLAGGKISTFAGNGGTNYNKTAIHPWLASLLGPTGVAVDPAGDVIISDTLVQRVAWVDRLGILYTLAGLGNGSPGFSGDGGLATHAELNYPRGVATDLAGNIYITEPVPGSTGGQSRVRKVSAIGNLNTSVNNINFGNETMGRMSTARALTLSSVGPLEISSISVTGDYTYADHCPSQPASGSSCVVDVFFKPTAVGLRDGSLTIQTDGYFNKTLKVQLFGAGTAPATIAP
jgi:hypothetical protein